jgi:hypothetical protein
VRFTRNVIQTNNKQQYHAGVDQMNCLTRRSITLGAVVVALGVASGPVIFTYAREGANALTGVCTASLDVTKESPFLDENGAAMTKMMNDMAVRPTGDVDADFVAMMAPHHQGAIEMAKAVLRYGRNAQIKRLAQEIIVTQQQEIAAMRLAIGEPLPPAFPSPTQLSVWRGPHTR